MPPSLPALPPPEPRAVFQFRTCDRVTLSELVPSPRESSINLSGKMKEEIV